MLKSMKGQFEMKTDTIPFNEKSWGQEEGGGGSRGAVAPLVFVHSFYFFLSTAPLGKNV